MAGALAVTLAQAGLVAAALGSTAAILPATDAELRQVTDTIASEVANVRGLPAPRGLEARLVRRADAFAARSEAIAATASSPDGVARARLWEALGLLPEGADYARLMARSLGAPTATYDIVRRRLSVPDWIPLVDQQGAIAHELAHAIADQRFGLRQLLGIGLDGHHTLDGDAERARLALVEGDAGVTALERADPRGAFQSRPELTRLAERLRASPPEGTPPWLRASAVFAHADGLLFVGRVRARAPWSAVDALWAEPPASSEQVLHPEKYAAREKPVAVAIERPRAIGDGWRAASSDVLGELGVRVWLEAATGRALAERGAAGWGGDRAVLYEPEGVRGSAVAGSVGARTAVPDAGADASVAPGPRPFAAWSTVWDDVTDAEDFARTAAQVLASLSGDVSAATSTDPARVVARRGDLVWALAWRGTAVVILAGAPESALGALDELLPPAPASKKAGKASTRAPKPIAPRDPGKPARP